MRPDEAGRSHPGTLSRMPGFFRFKDAREICIPPVSPPSFKMALSPRGSQSRRLPGRIPSSGWFKTGGRSLPTCHKTVTSGAGKEKGRRVETRQPCVSWCRRGICPPGPCPSGYSLRGTPGSAFHLGVGPLLHGFRLLRRGLGLPGSSASPYSSLIGRRPSPFKSPDRRWWWDEAW